MKLRKNFCLLILGFVLFLGGCAGQKNSNSTTPDLTAFQRGIASWYGEAYHGRKTASGEIFNMNDLTAAHRTLGFNTLVEVERTANGRRVRVRINDRGPFTETRILDLSKRAADQLGMLTDGLAEVTLRIVETR